MRSVAQQRGLDSTDRTILQDLGEELIGDGWIPFVAAVLRQAQYSSGPIVIEGIRHLSAIEALRTELAPTPLFVVAVDISDEVRERRLRRRGGLKGGDMKSADSHSNESEVDDVIRTADLVVPEHLTVDEACEAVMNLIRSL